jgi:hypothetical protein
MPFKNYDDSKEIIALATQLDSVEAAKYAANLRSDRALAEEMGLDDVVRFCQAKLTMFMNAECLIIITDEEKEFVDTFHRRA